MSRARSIGTLTGLNVIGSGLGLSVSVVTAAYFGTTRQLEVFFAATSLQQILLRFIQSGQITEAFLPVYRRIRALRGIAEAQLAYAVTLNWAALASIGGTIVMWFAAPLFLRILVPGFAVEDRELGVIIFRVIALTIPLQLVGALQIGLSNAEKWFGRPEATGLAAQLVTLTTIPLLASKWGVWALVAAMVASQIVQNVGCIWVLRLLGYRHRWCLSCENFSPREVYRNLWSTSGQMAAAQLFGIAMNAGLSLLPQGSFAVFKYVQQIVTKVSGLFLRPVVVVFFTHFAEAMQEGAGRVRLLARSAVAKTLLLSIAAVGALSVCALPVLRGLWGSARFPPDQLKQAASLLVVMMCLLVPQAMNGVLRKLLVAGGLMSQLYLGIAAILIAAAPVARWLAPAWGLSGFVALQLATQLLQVVLAWLLLSQLQPQLLFRLDWRHLFQCIVVVVAAATVTDVLATWLGADALPDRRPLQLALGAVLGGFATVLMVAGAWVAGIPEFERIRSALGKTLRRMRRTSGAIQ